MNSKKKAELLRLASGLLNSIVKGLSQVGLETRKKIMELCGEACARAALFGVRNLDIAERIAEEEASEEEILERANEELLWCSTWTRKGKTIQCTCVECGCPLVNNKVVELTGTFCYCSRGWVKKIFETLLKKLSASNSRDPSA